MKKINVLLALVVAATFVNCTKKQSSGDKLNQAETLNVNIATEPPTLDWNKAVDATSSTVVTNIMEGLFGYDLSTSDLKVKNQLVESYSTKDNIRWKFTLKKGIKWTDGIELSAKHVRDGWIRLLDPATASNYSYFLYPIKNAKAYNQGKTKDVKSVGVKIVGTHGLEVELNSPVSYFPLLLTHTSTFPVRMDIINKYGDSWTEPSKIQTLGPYKLKSWVHDKAIVAEANPNYYGVKPKISNIHFLMIQEQSTAINLFDTGKLDYLDTLPATEMKLLKQREEFRTADMLGTYYFGFNVKKPPFDNVKVRKAIALAIDKSEIIKVLDGGQTLLGGWIPRGMFGYDEKAGIKYNVEKAKKLLDEAGFKDRSKFPKVTFGFNTNENHQKIAENMQAQIKRNLGIDVELKNSEWKVYLKALETDAPHMFRMGWIADYPDPDNFFNLMTSDSAQNRTRWGNKRFDELIKLGLSESKKSKRLAYYKEAQKILTEDEVPVIPIYSYVSLKMISNRVNNFKLNSLGMLLVKDLEIKK